jgi:hypothetical protein
MSYPTAEKGKKKSSGSYDFTMGIKDVFLAIRCKPLLQTHKLVKNKK